MKHTSKETSKQLNEWGCDLRGSVPFYEKEDDKSPSMWIYDILWDVCVKYAKEFFIPAHVYFERRSDVNFMVSRDECTKGQSDCWIKGYAGDWSYTMGICPNYLNEPENCTCEDGLNEDTIEGIIQKHTQEIFRLIQQNKTKEAEKYLLEHCVFNPKNRA